MKIEQGFLTVGSLATQTGITVRTLHHYEALGLLRPSKRSRSGYRLYGSDDIARLHTVRSLQELGLPLKQIKTMVTRNDVSFADTIDRHLAVLAEKIRMEKALHERLTTVRTLIKGRAQVPIEEVIRLLKMMDDIKKFGLNPDDETKLRTHWGSLTQADIEAVEAEWPKLIAEVRTCMKDAVDPKSPKVQALAKRWMELVNMFTAGIPQMAERTRKQWEEHGDEIRNQHGDAAPDPAMFTYIQKALER